MFHLRWSRIVSLTETQMKQRLTWLAGVHLPPDKTFCQRKNGNGRRFQLSSQDNCCCCSYKQSFQLWGKFLVSSTDTWRSRQYNPMYRYAFLKRIIKKEYWYCFYFPKRILILLHACIQLRYNSEFDKKLVAIGFILSFNTISHLRWLWQLFAHT